MVGAFNPLLVRNLSTINVSAGMRQELYNQRIKLAAIEIPSNVDIATRETIQRSIDESFLAGFRAVLAIASVLALASAATAWLIIKDPSRCLQRNAKP